MNADQVALNGRNRLLAALKSSDFALLSPHLLDLHLKQEMVLQEADDPIRYIYFPHSGMISLLAAMQEGKAVETATVGREGAVGIMAGLGGRRAAGRAVVQVEGRSSQISVAPFRAAIDQSDGIRNLIVRYNDTQIALIQQSAGCNALHHAEKRLCRWLLQTRDRSDSDVLSLTHEFLSDMLGVQRTSVTLIARQLQTEGLIRYRRGRVEITDRMGLEKRACECYVVTRRKSEDVFSHPESLSDV
jgi:CRP-like cAMP-binding protein